MSVVVKVSHSSRRGKDGKVYSRVYQIKPSTHWSDAITVYYGDSYGEEGTSLNWCSGGIEKGVTVNEVAEAMVAAWAVAKAIIDHHEQSADEWPIPEENQ